MNDVTMAEKYDTPINMNYIKPDIGLCSCAFFSF